MNDRIYLIPFPYDLKIYLFKFQSINIIHFSDFSRFLKQIIF